MTKQEATKQLKFHARHIVDPKYAEEIAQAMGTSLEKLGVKAKTGFAVLPLGNEDKPSVAIYELAQALAGHYGKQVSSNMHGRGSYAEDITLKSIAVIEKATA